MRDFDKLSWVKWLLKVTSSLAVRLTMMDYMKLGMYGVVLPDPWGSVQVSEYLKHLKSDCDLH